MIRPPGSPALRAPSFDRAIESRQADHESDTGLAAADGFTHLDDVGNATMVDVSAKAVTARTATARGLVRMAPETVARIAARGFAKGDVLSIAQLAGIMGAKRTADLIPLCHPLGLEKVELRLELIEEPPSVAIEATCQVTAKTGVEMEALTAVTVAALTIYDMCKAVDRSMILTDVRLTRKTGGRSGTFEAA
ncbi:cyclic pyranopterin monophosphate synthase subunit MoaC [Arboricoccus pini]|uniref:Cyclic pyranopterin monophosphate synthase n=1 Tax=Arboricoccus pini TaxID=1963835 RepID=A0A212QP06_9PROT|nr:cyclic pyranopterin monophosphate synthase MoaC [Arboricoccus pini]SNB61186.1 cyclic pyranopterin monophosphate synthase subunit MoaC [Arboricoccus pini]